LPKRTFRDRDHLLTRDGLYFTVVGNVHPQDRKMSYLKYFPKSSKESKNNLIRTIKQYDIPNLVESIKIVERNYPHYLCRLENYDFKFPSVPIIDIKKHFIPEEKLSDLLVSSDLDSLSQKVLDLTKRLSKESGISINDFGITGSILLGIHDPNFSDIDITVYGKENSLKVKETLLRILKNNDALIKKADGEFLLKSEKRFRFMNKEQLKIFFERKWNRGTFKGTFFSVNPVKTETEITENYGDKKYSSVSLIEAEACVIDSSENMFIPANYAIEETHIIKGSKIQDVNELVSYDRNYADLAEKGETILFKGKLEKVFDIKNNETSYRAVVGSLDAKGMDYIKIKT